MKRENGFSIIELMIVIVLIAIVSAIAIPNFTAMVKKNRMATQANALIASINMARSEAIKRNLSVTLCRSADGASCAGAGGWEQGWIVYADINSNNAPDAGEIMIVHQALAKGSTLIPNANYTTSVTYLSRGFVNQAGGFVLCPGVGDFAFGRAIVISPTGRPRIDAASAVTTPNFTNCNGT